MKPFTYCAIEVNGSFYENQQSETVKLLKEEVKKQNINVLSNVIGVWHTPYPKVADREDLRWEKGYIIDENTQVKPPLVKKRWEITRGYSQVFHGVSDEAGKFWDDYWDWFTENRMRTIRPLLDINLEQPKTNSNGETVKKYEVFTQAVYADQPYLMGVEPFKYCTIEARGSWSQSSDIHKKLDDAVKKQNVPVKGDVVGVWYSYPDKTLEKDLKWELGYKLTGSVKVQPPLKIKNWETKYLYCQVYDGPSSGSDNFFEDYWDWFKRNNLKVIRPLMEIDLPHAETDLNGIKMSKFAAYIETVKR